jgi:glycosyltransferase involved in cell wall biosynthesis
MPEVTVIIPTYNRSAFLREALTSVVGQRGVAPEIIVVDDGSRDDTPSVVDSFSSRVQYIRQSHSGVSAARNRGVVAGTGEWLAFLDSDDLWLPHKLSLQMDYVRADRNLKICQTGEIWIKNGRSLNPRKYHRQAEGHCFPRLLERCLVSPSAVVIHRDIFEVVGLFDETLPACEDYDMWLRVGCRFPIGLVKEKLVIKRGGHPDQLSASIPALDRYRIQSLVKLLRNEPLSRVQREMALQALDRKCRIVADGCRKRGSTEEAERLSALPALFASNPT